MNHEETKFWTQMDADYQDFKPRFCSRRCSKDLQAVVDDYCKFWVYVNTSNGEPETKNRLEYFVKKQGVISLQYREEIFDRITG